MRGAPVIHVCDSIALPESELEFAFVRSAGPGGQNVNKVATAVQLRFHVARSPSLPTDVRDRLMMRERNRITSGGYLLIRASRFRTQERNRADAVDRLVALIRAAAAAPRKRKQGRPTVASRHRRMENKRRRSLLKRTRSPVRSDD